MLKVYIGAALAVATPCVATAASMASWGGSTGYVFAAPIVASTGVVFGVLGYGSGTANGSVYALTPATGGASYTVSTLSSFTGGSSGGYPNGALYRDASGNLYGAAFGGGSTSTTCKNTGYGGCGVIYKLTPPASGTSWTRTVLYTFTGGTDGIGPYGSLTADSTGALYGITEWGGCTPTLIYGYGCGTVFKLTPPAAGKTAWTESVLYRFKGGTADGAWPVGKLALDSGNNIYGATMFGGTVKCTTLSGSPDGGCGTVFKLAYGSGSYTESLLHVFSDGTDGSVPGAGVVLDSTGNVYGTAQQGGTNTGLCLNFGYSGCGQVFELAKPASGSVWTKTTILNFSGKDGATPAALLRDSAGHLFGLTQQNTTAFAGCTVSYYCGTVFKLTLASGVWSEAVLTSFTGASSVAHPEFGLAGDSSGNLYGVTEYNVTSTVFKVTGAGYVPGMHPPR